MAVPRPTPSDKIDRYAKLLNVIADAATAPNERAVALRKLREIEDEYPTVRLDFAKRQAATTARPADPNAGAAADWWRTVTDAAGIHLGNSASRVAGATLEQLTAASVAAVERIIRDLEGVAMDLINIITAMESSEDFDTGTIDWNREVQTLTQARTALEQMTEIDEDDFGVVDGDRLEGDRAQLVLSLPLGLLLRIAKDPALSQVFVGHLVETIEEVTGDDDGDGEEAPAAATARAAAGGSRFGR